MKPALPMTVLCVLCASAVNQRPCFGQMATERWGAGRATYVTPGSGGVVVRYDLSALPKDAKVLRARFIPYVRTDGVPLEDPLVVQALSASPDNKVSLSAPDPRLELVGPRFMSFDATDVVRQWASGKRANQGLWVHGAKIDPARTCLDITFAGTPKDPPPPVTGLRAFCRAGQVFLTWKEVNSPFAGKSEVQWKELKADFDRIRAGTGAVPTYRIYRHIKPITAATLAEAELIDEVDQHSALDQREIRTEWKGEQIKNVRVDEAQVPRVAVEEQAELPPGVGAWAITCRKDGTFHYAVISAVNGVESTADLNAGSASGPVEEKVAPPEPILFRKQPAQYQKRTQDCYVWWIDPPLSLVPAYIHLGITAPEKDTPAPAPLPLVVNSWWWGSGWGRSAQCPLAEAVGFTLDQNCMMTRGIHDGYGTLKAWSQGQVRDYFVRQFRSLLPWLKARYRVDEDRLYAESSGWAWHYPDLFAVTFEATTMDPKRSPAGGECKRYWGDPKRPAPTEWGVSAWEYWDAADWIRRNPTAEMALMTYAPRMHTGDFGTLDKPPLYRALLDTKRSWSTIFHEGGLAGHRSAAWMFEIRRSDSLAAFGNCTLDDNPGIGLGGDPGGQMNGWLCFEPRTQVDQADRWEMTLYLLGGSKDNKGRDAAPLEECTTDVTPRRCRNFKPAAGTKFTWANTRQADGKAVQTGTAVADQWGLVTAEKVIVSKGKNRLVIVRVP
jgi:hypothetical protein